MVADDHRDVRGEVNSTDGNAQDVEPLQLPLEEVDALRACDHSRSAPGSPAASLRMIPPVMPSGSAVEAT
jgi:hypothetical protein